MSFAYFPNNFYLLTKYQRSQIIKEIHIKFPHMPSGIKQQLLMGVFKKELDQYLEDVVKSLKL